jgi:NAD(P)H-flavin reductase
VIAAAPFGRRGCEVVGNEATGGYRLVTVIDRDGPSPMPGQFYMLSMASRWGGVSGRPYLGRAFSVASAQPVEGGVRLGFLIEAIGPGTERLAAASLVERMELVGPLGNRFSPPHEVNPDSAGAILVAGGIGIAPIAMLRTELVAAGFPTRTLVGFRDAVHSGGLDLVDCSEIRIASDDGHRGHRGRVTDLLEVALAGDDSGSGIIYACGPPAMLEAVRLIAADRALPAELAMEAPMACGYGACYGCAVPMADGSLARLCVEGPVLAGSEIETAIVAGSGH